MIAIIYDLNGYLVGINAYIAEDDEIEFPRFFVEEVPSELLNVPENHRVKVHPVNRTFSYEALPTSPAPPVDRISTLEAENAGMALELAENQIRFNEMEQTQADLLLSLVNKGVL